MSAPLCLDLFCGRGGWARGFLDAGFRVIGIDNDPSFANVYPGEFVMDDVASMSGSDFRGARVVVASPPCTRFTSLAALSKHRDPEEGMKLVRDSVRIIQEVNPRFWAIENVHGAVRRISLDLGPPLIRKHAYYVWGNFPGFIMPSSNRLSKGSEGRWRKQIHKLESGSVIPDSKKAAEIPYSLARSLAEACLP